jgi:hypothetical protein
MPLSTDRAYLIGFASFEQACTPYYSFLKTVFTFIVLFNPGATTLHDVVGAGVGVAKMEDVLQSPELWAVTNHYS